MTATASSVIIERLEVRDLRNLEVVDVEPSASTNVLCGDNGQGKTSVLEAIYLAATTRSFRTHRLRELIRHGTKASSVKAWLSDPLGVRMQHVGLSSGHRVVRVDEQRPPSLAEYAVRTPVVVFHPGELGLTMGPASGRRKLMDRVSLFVDPASHQAQRAYTQAMRARQRLLQTEGTSASGLDAYEELMARHGVAWTGHRCRTTAQLVAAAEAVFSEVAPSTLVLSACYHPGGSEVHAEVTERLAADRESDRRRSSARFGPHRDDLVFDLNGRRVRTDASQGQHRLLTLSLKIAEMQCIASASGIHPLLLLDDVSSELDAERTDAFFSILGRRTDQVFLTTTRPEMLPVFERTMGQARVFEVTFGVVRPLAHHPRMS